MQFTSSWPSSAVVGSNGIILFGGYTWNLGGTPNNGNSVYLFNTSTAQWTLPNINGLAPARRREMKMVPDTSDENIYIYGGADLFNTSQWYTDMYVLDVYQGYRWVSSPMSNTPTNPLVDYTATLLPNGMIAYIGGRSSILNNGVIIQDDINIKQILIYDTLGAGWSPMNTTGATIDNRHSHSAVMTSDGRIIIFGGAKGPNSITPAQSLIVLDTSAAVYTWSILQPPRSQNTPPPLMLHTADLCGNYMIVAFGNITNGISLPTQTSSNIYMLDTTSYTWMTSYSPSPSSTPSSVSPASVGIIIGIICAVVTFVIIAVIVGVLIYKRYHNRLDNVIPTPGSNDLHREREGANNTPIRDSNMTFSNDSYNRNSGMSDSYRNSVMTDNTIISQTPSNLNKSSLPTQTYYSPIGGISPNNPPYGSRGY